MYVQTFDRSGEVAGSVMLTRDDGSVAFFDPHGDTGEARAYAQWLAAGNTPSTQTGIAAHTPAAVSPLQVRRALRQSGLFDLVQQWVSQAGPDAQDAWEYAISFDSQNALITAAAQALGRSPADIDDLFRLAAQL